MFLGDVSISGSWVIPIPYHVYMCKDLQEHDLIHYIFGDGWILNEGTHKDCIYSSLRLPPI